MTQPAANPPRASDDATAAPGATPPGMTPGGAAPAGTPRPYGEVRERIAALGEVSDLLARRPVSPTSARQTGTEGSVKGSAGGSAKDAARSEPRRRGFGTSAREAEVRRKRGSSKDVITWQRLGALAVFIAVVGGGAVMLQSLAAREEAKVADEVIGNAAVASVAPSAPMPVAAAAPAAPARPTPVQTAQLQQAAPTHSAAPVTGSLADTLPPVLRDTASPFDASTPVAVTAFAAPATAARSDAAAADTAPAAAPPESPPQAAAPKPVAMPKEAPLPPARPAVVASAEATPARAADAEPVSDDAESQAGFGGDPVGTATIRSSVTMRGAPRKGAAPIGNLSAGQKVELVACHGWCEVISEGKRGFIYKSFVNAGTSARADTEAEPDAATQ
ncbi:SH3 domain-containing protein [Starkeya koreensis]|uniref:SH3 domain-containing protein n=1 Tax=Ancylobacter koreensis TaxID=266121 RepID=A0ABT0DPG8_9HYPH|nr:SH3 domain-containing protein [Ancylobacter koreensis]MCK0209166.1 SH3 domain-containing protein [Ancylobacter koreensis]